MTRTSEYNSFQHAQKRCNNADHYEYHRYGARGIKFCFNSFEDFYEELGEKPEPKRKYSVE